MDQPTLATKFSRMVPAPTGGAQQRPRGRAPLAAAALALLASVGAYAGRANAQVEGRCPAGFTVIVPIAQATDGQRPVLACARPPVQLGALQVERTFEADSEDESGLVGQLVSRLGMQAPPPGLIRPETVGGITARVAELHGTGTSQEGASVEIEAVIALVRVGGSTLVVRGISTDGTRAHVRPAVMAALPTFVGLDGASPGWRVTATCPPGTQPVEDGPPANGMRRAVLCATADERRRVEVLESRLPVRTAAEAHAEAEHYQQIVQRALAQLGGRVVIDPAVPFTAGALRGFSTAMHASATPPPGMQGAPPGGVHLEQLVVTVPSPSGHVQIAITADGASPAEVLQAAQAILQAHVRLDGPVLPSAPPGGAGAGANAAGDGGTGGASSSSMNPSAGAAPTAPRPRQRRVDPNAPLWTPGNEEPLRASDPNQGRASRGACGCRVPGGPNRDGAGRAALLGLLAGGLSSFRRGNRRRR